MNNHITAIGRLTEDAAVRFTAQGSPVANFTIAFNERRKNASGDWEDGQAHFLDVTAWRALAESCADLTKGQRVVVVGELKSRHWDTKEGEKRTAWQVEAEEVGVLLDRFARRDQGAGWSKDTNQTDPWSAPSTEAPF